MQCLNRVKCWYILMDFCPHLIVTLSAQYLAAFERLHMHKQNTRIPGNRNASPSSFLKIVFSSLPSSLPLPLPLLQLNLFDVWFWFLLHINKRDVSYLDYCMSHYNTNHFFCHLLSICCNLAPISIQIRATWVISCTRCEMEQQLIQHMNLLSRLSFQELMDRLWKYRFVFNSFLVVFINNESNFELEDAQSEKTFTSLE